MGEWRQSVWGDEVDLNYGKAIRGYKDATGRYQVFGSNGPIGWWKEPLSEGPGIILGRKGAYRGVHYSEDPFYVIDTAYFVVPKKRMNMRWLYYAIIHHKLGEIDDGSPIPSTTRSAVYVRSLEVPDNGEQDSIANVLSALDDKIELNRRANETLEAMAQALFRDWFVDFGPVKRKMEGARDAGQILGGLIQNSDEAAKLAALFPDKLGDNGLPEGWREGSLGDWASITNGYAFSSKNWQEQGVPVVKIGAVEPMLVNLDKASFVGAELAEEKSNFQLPAGSALVGMTGYVGTVGRVPPTQTPPLLNQRVGRIVPNNADFSPFSYTACRTAEFKDHAEKKSHGSAQANVSAKDLMLFPVATTQQLVSAFDNILNEYFELQLRRYAENQTLAQTRDYLLPKLMSGQIRAGQAEGMVAA